MTLRDIITAIALSPISHAIAKSNHLVTATVQVIHIGGFLLLLTTLTLMFLRVFGLVLTRQALPEITRESSRLFWLGFVLVIASGILLFLTGPFHYYFNRAFDVKMGLMFAAILVQATLMRQLLRRDNPSVLTKVGIALCMVLWFGVSWAGRAIGFV